MPRMYVSRDATPKAGTRLARGCLEAGSTRPQVRELTKNMASTPQRLEPWLHLACQASSKPYPPCRSRRFRRSRGFGSYFGAGRFRRLSAALARAALAPITRLSAPRGRTGQPLPCQCLVSPALHALPRFSLRPHSTRLNDRATDAMPTAYAVAKCACFATSDRPASDVRPRRCVPPDEDLRSDDEDAARGAPPNVFAVMEVSLRKTFFRCLLGSGQASHV